MNSPWLWGTTSPIKASTSIVSCSAILLLQGHSKNLTVRQRASGKATDTSTHLVADCARPALPPIFRIDRIIMDIAHARHSPETAFWGVRNEVSGELSVTLPQFKFCPASPSLESNWLQALTEPKLPISRLGGSRVRYAPDNRIETFPKIARLHQAPWSRALQPATG